MEPAWAWRVLGLAPGADQAACRRAFRSAAQLLHPDRVADLPAEVRSEAHRRMSELAEAYRTCTALIAGAPLPTTRAPSGAPTSGALRHAGGRAQELLAQAEEGLSELAGWDAYRAHRPTVLDWSSNASRSRDVVQILDHVADAWPGTVEGDRARTLLVTSVAARNSLSARERANHLVLVIDDDARAAAWDGLVGRDELAVAQVVYAHPTAAPDLRRRARARLAELDDWTTLAADEDEDVRSTAGAHVLVQQARGLAERAPWLSRRERPGFDAELAEWRRRAAAARHGSLDADLRMHLDAAERAVDAAVAPARSGRG